MQTLAPGQVPRLLTVAEVAAELRVSYHAALGLIHRGVVPGRKVGKAYRVRRQDLDALMTPAGREG